MVVEGDGDPVLTVPELGRIVRDVDPRAFVVASRIVRRVIKHERGLPALVIHVPHRRSYVLPGFCALQVVDRDELGLRPSDPVPATVLLISAPEADELSSWPLGKVLVTMWRRLFHARVHLALEARFADGTIDAVGLRERIRRVGFSTLEEARTVLRQDETLLPPRDDAGVYVEFVAVYLELRAFAPHLVPRYFPSIRDLAGVDRVLAEDLDADALLAATRPAGAPEPEDVLPSSQAEEPGLAEEIDTTHEPPSGARYQSFMDRADRAAEKGNLVRAAILRMMAARLAGHSRAGQARSAARGAMDRLADRLRKAIDFGEDDLRGWRKSLSALLDHCGRGGWTPEARLLYDLQKVCVDHERAIYAVDVIEWARTFGRRPIRRLLPNHQEVLIVQHLRKAAGRLTAARMSEADRRRLSRLLTGAVHRAEAHLRDRFRPEIARTLDENGFAARNLPERVALRKLTEELLDQIVERGFLAMGDLRDALSRNNRKLPDLSGPVEFLTGDRLIRADGRLAIALDGVYRRGEAYLRALQRLSALAFGTKVGRVLTRYLVLPWAGTFVVLEGLQHVVGPVTHALSGHEVHVLTRESYAAVGTVALFLIASRRFRAWFFRSLGVGYDLSRGLIVGVPSWVLRQTWVRLLLGSRALAFAVRAFLLPLGLAYAAWSTRPEGVSARQALPASALIFLTTCMLLTTRAGRNLEEIFMDAIGRAWSAIVAGLIPGLFRLVLEFFDRIMEALERLLYAVDEWLRFRSGEGNGSIVAKGFLGVFWFLATYVVRFCVTILIEPQINPIKHFPVVTVSHKILLTQSKSLLVVMVALLGRDAGAATAATILLLLPGVFGFLVWELKENWRLYEANRPKTLRPVTVGHHGETLARLLKPGFHSGTVPKLYAKLRRAERKARRTGKGLGVRKHLAQLHGVEEAVGHFVSRDFLTLLLLSRSMSGARLEPGKVVSSVKRLLVEIRCSDRPGPSLWLAFEEYGGWVVAGVAEPGWASDLSEPERRAVTTALAGLYKMSGVDLVREPIEAALGSEKPAYEFRETGLVVWPDPQSAADVIYLLRPVEARAPLVPVTPTGEPESIVPPPIDARRLLFSDVAVAWKRWVEVWERDREGIDHPAEFVEGFALLPDSPSLTALVDGVSPLADGSASPGASHDETAQTAPAPGPDPEDQGRPTTRQHA
ncbi:hypothetical protein TA3x_005348 [Tundrisphaera sp. TA3]|uniref:hypothetical protein n=1 Tax=Tundrisphaera sp. TA3 TaxID=3435775 RepID=UPI003EBEE0EA